MGLLVFVVYLGGCFALPRRKIGFSDRLFWPGKLGEAIHAWALERVGQ